MVLNALGTKMIIGVTIMMRVIKEAAILIQDRVVCFFCTDFYCQPYYQCSRMSGLVIILLGVY